MRFDICRNLTQRTDQATNEMRGLHLLLGTAVSAAMVPLAPISEQRSLLRASLLQLLPAHGAAPAHISDELAELVQQLEELEYTPATAAFHSLGVAGGWDLRAMSSPPGEAGAVQLRGAEQAITPEGTLTSWASFVLEEGEPQGDALRGVLEVSSTLSLTPRADSLDLRTSGRSLRVPRAPAALGVPALLEQLHAQLSPDYRADDGVRLGLQTTYLDEEVRITRCTTGKAHGECTVHVRQSARAAARQAPSGQR